MRHQIVGLASVVMLLAAGCASAPVEDSSPLYVAERQEPSGTADVTVRFEDDCAYAYDDFGNYREANDERALIAFAPGVAERINAGRLLLTEEGGALTDSISKTLDFHRIFVGASWQDALDNVVWQTTAPTDCSAEEIWIVASGDTCCPES